MFLLLFFPIAINLPRQIQVTKQTPTIKIRRAIKIEPRRYTVELRRSENKRPIKYIFLIFPIAINLPRQIQATKRTPLKSERTIQFEPRR